VVKQNKNYMISDIIKQRLIDKAKKGPASYKVSAIALNKKGEILGFSVCSQRRSIRLNRRGSGVHAERKLISQYGTRIKIIIICRVGKNDILSPIHPCITCKRIADRLNIKIYSISEV